LQRAEGTVSQPTFLNRQALYLRPDPARVIVRPFRPATEPRDLNPTDKTRANHIVERVLALGSEAAASQLADVLENFLGRHRNLLETFEARADEMEEALAAHGTFSKVQRQLIGAYFLNEYSFEASALFNPSIVPHPDQSGIPKGALRFVLSLRAVGEGHVSSLTFRAGTIGADGSLSVDPTARLASSPRIGYRISGPIGDEVEVIFEPEEDISERIIFPVTEAQSNGIQRWWPENLLRDLYRLQRRCDPIGADRDQRFHLISNDAAARGGGAQQGHGAVSAKDRRQVRDDRAAG
jgi:hypothetical protein